MQRLRDGPRAQCEGTREREREKRETMALMQENEKLKSACRQSFGVDVKRGDGSGKRKGHQSTPPDCLGVPGERSILRREPETRQVGEGTKRAPRSSATITNKCHIIFEKFGAWNFRFNKPWLACLGPFFKFLCI